MTTRRNLFAFALAGPTLAMLGACQTGSGRLPAGTRIGAVRVDASLIAAQGWGDNARGFGQDLQRRLVAALGPAYQPGAGPTLEVVLRGLRLTAYAGGGGGGRRGDGGNNGSDSLDSETMLVDRGRVLGNWPIASSLSPTSGGAWFRPDVDQRRIAALIESHAFWIRRAVLD
jgi:hypothetical protein